MNEKISPQADNILGPSDAKDVVVKLSDIICIVNKLEIAVAHLTASNEKLRLDVQKLKQKNKML